MQILHDMTFGDEMAFSFVLDNDGQTALVFIRACQSWLAKTGGICRTQWRLRPIRSLIKAPPTCGGFPR